MRWLAGTSGYSYKQWRGPFYPENLRMEDMLAFYATRLPAVEINNTFYRIPRIEVLRNWADAVPREFRFVLKASRRITHHKRLLNATESIAYLAQRVDALEDKLGAVLFQLPPTLRKDHQRLSALLSTWPGSLPAAIEFRHPSWFDQQTFDALAEHDVAVVVAEDDELAPPPQLTSTHWAYLRLRKPGYTTASLNRWIKQTGGTNATLAYAFFKHEDQGAGPALAEKFLVLASKPAPKRAAQKPRSVDESGKRA